MLTRWLISLLSGRKRTAREANISPHQISEAVKIWTDWQVGIMPARDDGRVVKHFGPHRASELLPVIKALEDEFDASKARFMAADLAEMARMSIEDFKGQHPELPDDVAEAFAWCYTFDYK